MFSAKTIIENCHEFAELEYRSAKAKGVPDPVVELTALDEENPKDITLAVWQRPMLAEAMRDRYIHITHSLSKPPIDSHFTVVVVSTTNAYFFNMPLPPDDVPQHESTPEA